jgi:hypothetical protein
VLIYYENELEAPSSVTNKWIYFQIFESFKWIYFQLFESFGFIFNFSSPLIGHAGRSFQFIFILTSVTDQNDLTQS